MNTQLKARLSRNLKQALKLSIAYCALLVGLTVTGQVDAPPYETYTTVCAGLFFLAILVAFTRPNDN